MTLYKQISAGIVLLFIICFAGTVYISTGNLKHFLSIQLDAHAQDTATSLGLSISPHMQSNDLPVVETMINAIFNRGNYQRIALLSNSGETLVEKTASGAANNVPQWFVNAVSLHAPAAEAMVMAGWKQAGSIHVTSNPGNAHRELWTNTIDTFWLFLACAAVLVVIGLLTLRMLLQPLRRVELQASAICDSNYEVQDTLPRTRELRRVVMAMNRLSEKVGTFFSEQSALTEKLREQAYRDTVTGLGNRRYFDRQMAALLSRSDNPTQGALLLLELHDFAGVNDRAGFAGGDAILKRMAELITLRISEFDNCFAARLSGAGFGIVATGLAPGGAEELAASLCRDMMQLRADGLVEINEIGHVGVSMWQYPCTLPELLAEADVALRAAQACGYNTWQRFVPPAANQSKIYGAEHWRMRLREVLDAGHIMLESQPVYGTGSLAKSVMQHEVLCRIPDIRGNGIAASIFMPMAERLGLSSRLDKLTANALLEHLRHSNDRLVYALNLSAGALHDAVFIQWLCGQLEQSPSLSARLQIEFSENAVHTNMQNVRNLVQRLADMDFRCGIDHFGRGFFSFGYLRTLKVHYVKIDGSYTQDIDTDEDNRFFFRALTETAHSIDMEVIAQSVETPAERKTLESLDVDGIQGYLTGKPAPLVQAAS
ncbi:MAG: EAL domain-containing protein [Gammaproteobacteria bacterium]|nr:EAL domain-containing protein [Gammaproteobacteria bacterium]